jgi:hypothetical protein
MAKFAIAFINFHDNELKITFAEASSAMEAAKAFLTNDWDVEGENFTDLQSIKNFCWDGDAMIDVKELPPLHTNQFAPPTPTVEGN